MILVTSGTGFIGADFVLDWLTQGDFAIDCPGHDRRYAINASKLEQVLGWKPAETFETDIRNSRLTSARWFSGSWPTRTG